MVLALLVAVPLGLSPASSAAASTTLLMRIMDGLSSFPALVLALAIVGVLGPGLANAMIAITIVIIPGFARLIRGQTLAVREETFIEASQSIGHEPGRIRRTRVLPNVASPLIVQASLALGSALLAEAGLSFLGLGVQPPDASWGVMLSDGRTYIFTGTRGRCSSRRRDRVHVLAFNTLGDGLRDALGLGLPKGKQAHQGPARSHDRDRARRDPARRRPADRDGALLAVDGLSRRVPDRGGRGDRRRRRLLRRRPRARSLGLVGEIGSGKTVTSLAIMRLLAVAAGPHHRRAR